MLDVATKFIVVRPVQSLNTDATIQVLMSIFSEHSLPVGIRCDRGRNFVSDLQASKYTIVLFQCLPP